MTKVDMVKLSQLARIALSEHAAKELEPQIAKILEFVSQLQSVSTTKVEVTSQVTGLIDVWREDEVRPCGISRDQLFQNTPSRQDGYIKVKRVL